MQNRIEIWVGAFVLAALAILAYMGFQIGAFRFDRMRYNEYVMVFKDVSGLLRKAQVKIAGVKVGWVEELNLIDDGEPCAEAKIMVIKEYSLYSNAYAIVRQEGLLGPKYLEVIPGDPLYPVLQSGDALSKPSVVPVSIDGLLQQVKNIAGNIQDVTNSLKGAMGGVEGQEQLKGIFNNLNVTAERMASFSDILERSFVRNEENIDAFLEVGANVRRLTEKLEADVFPSFQESMEKISDVFDRDFNRVATKLDTAVESFEEASLQARDGFRSVGSIAEKIDEGQGLLGKLVNEDETYRDLKVAVQGLKNYVAKTDMLQIVFDAHGESMYRPAENYEWEDTKGYLDIRIHPNEDRFYLIQLASSEKGYITRREQRVTYYDEKGTEIDTSLLDLKDWEKLFLRYNRKYENFWRGVPFKIGLQMGKIFKNIAVRGGLFENSIGMAVDFEVPFENDAYRWVMSMEIFDFKGWNRDSDRRPHLKWINRIYFMDSLYSVFGADDFISKHNANIFAGFGIRFGDDDIKYLLPSFGSASSVNW